MIDAHQVQDRGLEVVHRHRIRHHAVAEVVGLTEHGAARGAAIRDPQQTFSGW